MQHRDPSPASVMHASRVLAVLRESAGIATAAGVAAGVRSPGHAGWLTFESATSRDPIAIAIAATSLAVPTAGAFIATEDVAAGMMLIVLAWIPLVACCLDLLQAAWNERVRRRRSLASIAACPAPQGREGTRSAGADATGPARAPCLLQASGKPSQARPRLQLRDAGRTPT